MAVDAPAPPPAAAEEVVLDPSERSYWQIVRRQFERNRRAVWGMRVVISLFLLAIFAPLIANEKPLLFHGYRYKRYTEGYDQVVYAHADLVGLGSEEQPLMLPGLYPEGIHLRGLPHDYREQMRRWEAGNPTWKMIRNVAFGAAQEPMNRLRGDLEEYIKRLRQDVQWAHGTRDVAWLKEQKLPSDLERDLERLVALCRANVAEAFQAKTQLRRQALLLQLRLMRGEVSAEDRRTIDRLMERYEALVGPKLYERDPGRLADFDAHILEVRRELAPSRVSFAPHTDFPALRQLTALDMLFMLAALLWFARGLWSWPLGWRRLSVVPRTQRQLVVVLVAPVLAALAWLALVPDYNDTTDYKAGMRDGSVYCDFRIMPPLRYGVNENDTDAKYQPPWWQRFFKRAKAAPPPEDAAPGAGQPPADGLDADLARLDQRLEELRTPPEPEGAWQGFLEGLTRHHMGTDGTGRDLLTRMVWGSRISLSIGFVAVGIYAFIGIFLGSLAGYFGGWIDMVISRVIEVVICFPTFFLILTVIAFIGPSVFNIMVVIGVTGWTGVARLVRGEFLRLRKQDFVVAGKALGFSDARIIFRHVLPSALAPVLVAATFGVASAILVESSLSFLGFGVKVPTPTWGSVLSSARENWTYWWLTMFPGLAIFLTITMYNLVGEGVRDAVDPKLRQ